jgi:PAS domain-containing protein
MLRPILRILSQYVVAVIAVGVATTAALTISHFNPHFLKHGFFALFLVAVAISAWQSGFRAALLAICLSVVVAAWMLPPANSFHVDNPEDVVRIGVFIVVSLLISSLHAARERTEKKLRESELRLAFALESSGVGCWDADIKSGTFWGSPNLPELYGRSENEFTSTCEGFFAYIHPEDRDFFRLASVKGGMVARTYEISHRIICGDGSVRKVHTRGRMYLDREGKIERMVGSVHLLEPLEGKGPAAVVAPGLDGIDLLSGLTASDGGRQRPRSTEADQAGLLR